MIPSDMFLNNIPGQIFAAVVVIIVGLGGMAIYSLQMANVGDKTYEYGMLRALGRHVWVCEGLCMLCMRSVWVCV